MFMQDAPPSENVSKFHSKLERRYSGVQAQPSSSVETEIHSIVPKGIVARGRSVSDSPSTLLIPNNPGNRLSGDFRSSPLSASPVALSPTKVPEAGTPLSTTPTTQPRVEHQVIDLTQKLRETTTETKELVTSITNAEVEVEKLKDQHREAEQVAAGVSQAMEETVPVEKFEELKAEVIKAEQELKEASIKSEEGERKLLELRNEAAKLTLITPPKDVEPNTRKELGEKEALEQAVVRLKEQVESATSAAKDRRLSWSSQSQASERTAPSSTRVPLNRVPRSPETGAQVIDMNVSVQDLTPSPLLAPPSQSPPASNRSRRSQVISFCPSPALPQRIDLERQITQFYEDAKKPAPPPPLQLQASKPKEDIQDVIAMMDSITEDGFSTDILSLNFPKVAPQSVTSPTKSRDSMSLRSGKESFSVRSGKKKPWSFLKAKLSGSSTNNDNLDGRRRNDGPPTLAPIAQPSPISFSSLTPST